MSRRTETSPAGVFLTDFEYDNRGRLTRETRSESSTTLYDIEYTYDELGNRLTKTEHEAQRQAVGGMGHGTPRPVLL